MIRASSSGAQSILRELTIILKALEMSGEQLSTEKLSGGIEALTGTSIETIEKRSTVRKLAPRYRVLLHNDDFNSMEHVVQALMKTVPSLTQPQAVNIMMEAHTNGIALVITCALEHAEFYSETLKLNGLTSTIEPDE